MDANNTAGFLEKHWKAILIVGIIGVVIYFWKDFSNMLSSIFGGAQSLLNPLGNTANTAELNAANQTIASEDASAGANTASSNNPYGDPWTPIPYNTAGTQGDTSLDDDTATQLAGQIWSSWGDWISYAPKMLSALQQCQCQMDVSHISAMYTSTYSSQMYDDLSIHYDSSSNKQVLAQAVAFVKGLPLFIGS